MINQDQIKNLQDRQKCNLLHPYTCCNYNKCSIIDNRLIPKEDKWYCPCGNYTQEYKGEENDTRWKLIEESYKNNTLFKI